MNITLVCKCGQKLQVDERAAGRKGRCSNPACRAVVAVPPLEILSRYDGRELSAAQLDTLSGSHTLPDAGVQGVPLATAHASQGSDGRPSLCLSDTFTIEELLGCGGMGQVHLARQQSLLRYVAIKRILPDRDNDWSRRRFRAEAMLTGYLDHPNIVTVHAAGEGPGGEPYYAMKLLRGRSWLEALSNATGSSKSEQACEEYRLTGEAGPKAKPEQEPFDFEKHRQILLKVCDAVAYAHSKGILHRDLKPENVALGEYDEVAVIDWGLAARLPNAPKHLSEVPATRELKRLAGTPSYLAPEMIVAPNRVDERTDVWLLGAILYQILTGRPPNHGDFHGNRQRFLDDVVHGRRLSLDDPSHPRRLPASILQAAQPIVDRALNISPRRRFVSVQAFQQALVELPEHIVALNLTIEEQASLEQLSDGVDSSTSSSSVTSASHGIIATIRGNVHRVLEWIQRRVLGYEAYVPPAEKLIRSYDQAARLSDRFRLACTLWSENVIFKKLLAEVRRKWLALAVAANDVRWAQALLNEVQDESPDLYAKWYEKVRQAQSTSRLRSRASKTLKIRAGLALTGALATAVVAITIPMLKASGLNHRMAVNKSFHDAIPDDLNRAIAEWKTVSSDAAWLDNLEYTFRTSNHLADFGAVMNRTRDLQAMCKRVVPVLMTRFEQGQISVISGAQVLLKQLLDEKQYRQIMMDACGRGNTMMTLAALGCLKTELDENSFNEQMQQAASQLPANAVSVLYDETGSENEARAQLAADLLLLQGDAGCHELTKAFDDKVRSPRARRALEKLPLQERNRLIKTRSQEIVDALVQKAGDVFVGRSRRVGINGITVRHTLEISADVVGYGFSPDGRFAYTLDKTANLMTWDASTGSLLRTITRFAGRDKYSDTHRPLRLSPDGRYILLEAEEQDSTGDMRKLEMWDVATGMLARAFDGHWLFVKSACFSPDGKYVLSAGSDEVIKLWSLENGRCIRTYKLECDTVYAVSPDGQMALAAGKKGLLLFDLASGTTLRHQPLSGYMIDHALISPDGGRILWIAGHDTAMIDIESWKVLRRTGMNNEFGSFSPCGSYVMGIGVTGEDGIRVWNAETGEKLGIFGGFTGLYFTLSPDGRYLLAQELSREPGKKSRLMQLAQVDWKLNTPRQDGWEQNAESYLRNFLALHTPTVLPNASVTTSSTEDGMLALVRSGRPVWNDNDMRSLLTQLAWAGYGWIEPGTVEKHMKQMAEGWKSPPSYRDKEGQALIDRIAQIYADQNKVPSSQNTGGSSVATRPETARVARIRWTFTHGSEAEIREAIKELVGLGEEAMPAVMDLAALIKHQNGYVVADAVHALRDLGQVAVSAIPTLIAVCDNMPAKTGRAQDDAERRRKNALIDIPSVIFRIGTTGIHSLAAILSDRQAPVACRIVCAQVIRRFKAEAVEAVPALVTAATDEAISVALACESLRALGSIGPKAYDARWIIYTIGNNSSNKEVWTAMVYALEQIDPRWKENRDTYEAKLPRDVKIRRDQRFKK